MRRREEGFHEKSKLLAGQSAKEGYGNSELAKNIRSASVGHLGGSKSLGHFRVAEQPHIRGLPKSYSVAADGTPFLTPTQLGRQELYTQVPFTAVFGLQKLERTISGAFASYAAELDVSNQTGLTMEEKNLRASRASMIILDEIEFDAQVFTTPLVFAISTFFIMLSSSYCFGLPPKSFLTN